jgi:ABC-type multidrug transport system permease subunit
MRRLLVRLTVIAALLAAFVAGVIGILTGSTWSIIFLRATLAMAIVILVGAGVGLVLMRTALRRYYEQGRSTPGDRQARADR